MNMVFDKLTKIENELNQLKQRDIKTSVEEYSLNKTAKLLRVGQTTVMSYVNDGKLKARIVRNKKSRTGYSYKFTLREIYRFQNAEQFTPNQEKIISTFNAKEIVNQFHKTKRA